MTSHIQWFPQLSKTVVFRMSPQNDIGPFFWTLGHISDHIQGFLQLAKCNGISMFHLENHSGPLFGTRGHISDHIQWFLRLAKSNGISKFHPENHSGPLYGARGHMSDHIQWFSRLAKSNGISKFHLENRLWATFRESRTHFRPPPVVFTTC